MRNQRVRLHTRDDLLDFVSTQVSRRAITRALAEGSVEVLGGFKRVPPTGLPGWCLRAKSPITDEWYELGVTVDQGGVHRVWNLKPNGGIPWKDWVGWKAAYQGDPLMEGDNRNLCIARWKNERTSSEEEEARG